MIVVKEWDLDGLFVFFIGRFNFVKGRKGGCSLDPNFSYFNNNEAKCHSYL